MQLHLCTNQTIVIYAFDSTTSAEAKPMATNGAV